MVACVEIKIFNFHFMSELNHFNVNVNISISIGHIE